MTTKRKARIAPQENEYCSKANRKTDCAMCPPDGFYILTSIGTLFKWRLSRLDIKLAFLKTGSAERDKYVIQPRKSQDHGKMFWLLFTAAYGFVNENYKWQGLSYQNLIDT